MEYSRLSILRGEFRLLNIQRSQGPDGLLQCDIETVSLADPPSYTALSYCWLDRNIVQPILIGGHVFEITLNLKNALQQLYRKGYTRVWVDKICINQSDLEERGYEIQRMASIYRAADQVVAWVADHESGLDKALLPIEKIYEGDKGKEVFQLKSDDGSNHRSQSSRDTDSTVEDEGFGDIGPGGEDFENVVIKKSRFFIQNDQWHALHAFFGRQYWSRVWIIQELCAAHRVEVCWGQNSTSLEAVEHFLEYCESSPWHSEQSKRISQSPEGRHIRLICTTRKLVLQAIPLKLVDTLFTFRRAQATDIKDRVFALLSLAWDGNVLVPFPNYNSDTKTLNRQLTLAYIRAKNALDIIAAKPVDKSLRTSSINPIVPTPTWVFDWFSQMTWSDAIAPALFGRRDLFLHGRLNLKAFCAARDTRPDIVLLGGTYIMARGTILDQISSVSTDPDEIVDNNTSGPHLEEQQNQLGSSGNPRTMVLFRVLSGIFADHSRRKKLGAPISGFTDFLPFLSSELTSSNALAWLEANKSFAFDSHPLRSYLMGRHQIDDAERAKLTSARRNSSLFDTPTNFSSALRFEQVLRLRLKLMTTAKSRLGWTHPNTRQGDLLCLFHGCSVPVILRPRPPVAFGGSDRGGGYCIVGAAFVYNIMYGGGMDTVQPKDWTYLQLF